MAKIAFKTINKKRLIVHSVIGLGMSVSSTYASHLTKQTSVNSFNPVYRGAESVYLYNYIDNTSGNAWNSVEQALMKLKVGVKTIEDKAKIEGDWGKLRLKLDPKENYKKADLKYVLNF